ncbi:MAG: hypothetical protein ACLS29_08880 [Prevotellamassilia sp.]
MTEVRDRSRPFLEVFEALDPKAHRRALRSAMRHEGNNPAHYVAQIGSSGLGKGSRAKVAKGVRVRTFPDRYGAGFMLTVSRTARGIPQEPAGREKPVLMWRGRCASALPEVERASSSAYAKGTSRAHEGFTAPQAHGGYGHAAGGRGLFDTFRQNLDKRRANGDCNGAALSA